jgi:dTMP kinase
MQLLYIANRFEHKPRLVHWLEAGDLVVCDRYRASSVAYGEAQGLDVTWLEEMQRHLPQPTVTVLLDIHPETAAARKQANRDRYERDLVMLARVRDSYLRQAAEGGWVTVDAQQSREAVAEAVMAAVLPRLSPRQSLSPSPR